MAYTVRKAAERLGVCTKTVNRRINDGSLKAYRVGKAVRIADDVLDAYIRQNTASAVQ